MGDIQIKVERFEGTPVEDLVPPHVLAKAKAERQALIEKYGEEFVLAFERKVDQAFLFGR